MEHPGLFFGDNQTKPYILNSDYWDAKQLTTLREAEYNVISQKEFNTICKAEKIKSIRANTMFLDSLPPCFFRLSLDTVETELFSMKQPFPAEAHFPAHTLNLKYYGNAPANVRRLHLDESVLSFPETIYLPFLSVLVKNNQSNSAFPRQYLKDSKSIDTLILYGGDADLRGQFSGMNIKYLYVGSLSRNMAHKLTEQGLQLNYYESAGQITGFPDFDEASPIEQIEIKGSFRALSIPEGVSRLKKLKRLVLFHDAGDEKTNNQAGLAGIKGVEYIFANAYIEELVLINFTLGSFSGELKGAKALKRLSLKYTDGLSKEGLKFPAQLLNLENLEYLELQGSFETTEVDFTKLKKLKTLVLSGTKRLSPIMIEKLRKQEVKVIIN